MVKKNDFYNRVGYVEQSCGDCVIRIESWSPADDAFDEGFVDVQLISTHSGIWNMLLSTRIRNAWRVLRGRYDWSGFEITNKDEAESLVSEIEAASKKAFPNFTFGSNIIEEAEE